MAIADELEAAKYRRHNQYDHWLDGWLPTLTKKDRATVELWLNDPSKIVAQLFRVFKNHGMPGCSTGFEKWIKARRESR